MATTLVPCLLLALLVLAPALPAPDKRGLIFNLVRGTRTLSWPRPGDTPSAAPEGRGVLRSGSSNMGEPGGGGAKLTAAGETEAGGDGVLGFAGS